MALSECGYRSIVPNKRRFRRIRKQNLTSGAFFGSWIRTRIREKSWIWMQLSIKPKMHLRGRKCSHFPEKCHFFTQLPICYNISILFGFASSRQLVFHTFWAIKQYQNPIRLKKASSQTCRHRTLSKHFLYMGTVQVCSAYG
jgi:hypothetical protein